MDKKQQRIKRGAIVNEEYVTKRHASFLNGRRLQRHRGDIAAVVVVGAAAVVVTVAVSVVNLEFRPASQQGHRRAFVDVCIIQWSKCSAIVNVNRAESAKEAQN